MRRSLVQEVNGPCYPRPPFRRPDWWQGRQFNRLSSGFTEISQILSTRGDEGMVWLQHRGRDGIGPSIADLGVLRLVRDIAHDPEVVQRVRQIRMERAETGLLQKGRFA